MKLHPCNKCWRTIFDLFMCGGGSIYSMGCKCGRNISGTYGGCRDTKEIAFEQWNQLNPLPKRLKSPKKKLDKLEEYDLSIGE